MAEPLSPAGTAIGVAAASIVALLGVEPQALIYTAAGGLVGLPFAPKGGAVRTVALFCAVALISAACGTYASRQWGGGAVEVRNLAGAAFAAVFHPCFAVIIEYSPTMVRNVLDRLLARKTDKP